jgi:hypothetical protein
LYTLACTHIQARLLDGAQFEKLRRAIAHTYEQAATKGDIVANHLTEVRQSCARAPVPPPPPPPQMYAQDQIHARVQFMRKAL